MSDDPKSSPVTTLSMRRVLRDPRELLEAAGFRNGRLEFAVDKEVVRLTVRDEDTGRTPDINTKKFQVDWHENSFLNTRTLRLNAGDVREVIGFVGSIVSTLRGAYSRPGGDHLSFQFGGEEINPFGVGDPRKENDFHCRTTRPEDPLEVVPVVEQARYAEPGFLLAYEAWRNRLCAALHYGLARPFETHPEDRSRRAEAFDSILRFGKSALSSLAPADADRLARDARLEAPRRHERERERLNEILKAWETTLTPEGVQRTTVNPQHVLSTQPDPQRMLRAAGFDAAGAMEITVGSRTLSLQVSDATTTGPANAQTTRFRLEVPHWQGNFPLRFDCSDPRDVVAFAASLRTEMRVTELGQQPSVADADTFECKGIVVSQPWGMTDKDGDIDYHVDSGGRRLIAPTIAEIDRVIGNDFQAKYETWRNRYCAEILLGKREPVVVSVDDRQRWKSSFALIHRGGMDAVRRLSSPDAQDRVVREAKLAMRDMPPTASDRLRVAAAIREGIAPKPTATKPPEPEQQYVGMRR